MFWAKKKLAYWTLFHSMIHTFTTLLIYVCSFDIHHSYFCVEQMNLKFVNKFVFEVKNNHWNKSEYLDWLIVRNDSFANDFTKFFTYTPDALGTNDRLKWLPISLPTIPKIRICAHSHVAHCTIFNLLFGCDKLIKLIDWLFIWPNVGKDNILLSSMRL